MNGLDPVCVILVTTGICLYLY